MRLSNIPYLLAISSLLTSCLPTKGFSDTIELVGEPNESVIPDDFIVKHDAQPVPAESVPDAVEASYLTFNAIKNMALLPYDTPRPVANIRQATIPGVAIGMRAHTGSTMQTRFQMWALMRCLQILGATLTEKTSSPRCNFGFQSPPLTPEDPRIDVPLGRLLYLKTTTAEVNAADVNITDPFLDNDYVPSIETAVTLAPSNMTSISISSTPAAFFPDLSALQFPEPLFPQPPPTTDNGDENPTSPSYVAAIRPFPPSQPIPAPLTAAAFSYIEICQAADPRPRDQRLIRRQQVTISSEQGHVQVYYQPHDFDNPPEYEGYVEGFEAVMRELRSGGRWRASDWAVWRVSDRVRVLDGRIRRVTGPVGGDGGVEAV